MKKNAVHPLALALTFGCSLATAPTGALSPAPPQPAVATVPGAEAGNLSLRPAPLPSALERARFERWHQAWREEAAPLVRRFDAALGSLEADGGRSLRSHCVGLAGALLELDRARVLPVPDRAADVHLRRALRHLARAAVTCLTKRPYAARHALEQAAEASGQARRVLGRYRRIPQRSRWRLPEPTVP